MSHNSYRPIQVSIQIVRFGQRREGDVQELLRLLERSLGGHVRQHRHHRAQSLVVEVLDEGVLVPGWKRTGYAFKTWKSGTGPGNEACRFYGTPGIGPNSHFYTINAAECDGVKADPTWTFEGFAFRAVEPLSSGCESSYATVTRLYNNGMRGEANHRFLTDAAAIQTMVAKGWLVEGPVFCVPP